MTDKELEQRLEKALSAAAPDDVEGVLSRCEARKGIVIPMKKKNKARAWRALAAACLALVLVGGGGSYYYQANAVASVVSLDVNPSIELRVNQKEKVLTCTPLNEEARAVLADMGEGADLKGAKLDVAVNAIVGALVRAGYLDSLSSAILISVEDSDQDRAARLQQELTGTVDAVLQAQSAGAAILSQTVDASADLDRQARENNISTGKANLVNLAMGLNESLDFEALAALTVEELKDLVEIGAPAMPIGVEAARQAVEAYAGELAAQGAVTEVDPELDEYTPHYEVELYHPSYGEFEYIVDAWTGQVLSGQAGLPAGGGGAGSDTGSGSPGGGGSSASADIGQAAAKSAAFAHAGVNESQVYDLEIERDYDDGRLEYELEFKTDAGEYEYTVDGADGTIRKAEQELYAVPGAGSSGDIGTQGAKETAFAHAGVSESQVYELEVERDYDDGRLEYEVEFKAGGMEYEYTIDGATGGILEYERDR